MGLGHRHPAHVGAATASLPRPASHLLYPPGIHVHSPGVDQGVCGPSCTECLRQCVHVALAACHPGEGPTVGMSCGLSLEVRKHKCGLCPLSKEKELLG